ncbi:MAG: putative toxin-antitoxin system toxin component, PIN family [Patescibacteria group bacterium]|nr:putative toxin-antitoxin system toxin component, PIN family [Patescibacteria group bacterium]
MKVVLDTNVIMSGLLWKGNAKVLFDLIEKGGIEICLTPKILDEIKRVLEYPKIKNQLEKAKIDLNDVVFLLMQFSELYQDIDIDMVNVVSDDPTDNVFLNCALASGSKYIISGDKHLLKIKGFQNIEILTINDFLKKLQRNIQN